MTLGDRGRDTEVLLDQEDRKPLLPERPQDLVIYGGIGKCARNWESYHAIVKALKELENTETLGQVHPKGKEISLKTALLSVSIPLHPGAERYYREAGLLK